MRFFLFFSVLFFVSCGYIPSSKMAHKVFGEKIYVNVEISQQDPRNSIFVVDALREIVLNKFDSMPSAKDDADDIINVKMGKLDFVPIAYDKNGYVISYQARLNLEFEIIFKNGDKKNVNTYGSYDFDISPNSVISDSSRFEAIRYASNEAFDEFVSIFAIIGQRDGKYK